MNPLRFFHTIRYLKPVQIYGRIFHKVCKAKPISELKLVPRSQTSLWQKPINRSSGLICSNRFRFLNEEHTIQNQTDWNNPKFHRLWLYNLHYFDYLQSSERETKRDLFSSWISKWIKENPIGYGAGWEPYPISLRIVNWIKWSLKGNALNDTMQNSLACQADYLSKQMEYHLLANHLLANAKALIFAGLFFASDDAQKWFNKGLKVLLTEIEEQILSDGGHMELSPMYHGIVLEDLLDLVNIFKVYSPVIHENSPFLQAKLIDKIDQMLNWMHTMVHPDGKIPFFNDAAFEIAPTLSELESYAKRLKIEYTDKKQLPVIHLKSSGYARANNEKAVLFADIGNVGCDYQPGHAHADTLSFEISIAGHRIIVNSGTSTYDSGYERDHQRSTLAHNTVTINNSNSSDVWAGFRVGKRAYPFDINCTNTDESIQITASHDGYKTLFNSIVHQRDWHLSINHLQITDHLIGKYKEAVARFYLHPDITIEAFSKSEVIMSTSSGLEIKCKAYETELKVIDSFWYPEFGLKSPNKCIEAVFASPKIETHFIWN